MSCSWQLLYLVVSGLDLQFLGGFQPPTWLLLAIQLLNRMNVLWSPNLDILLLSYITIIKKDHSDFPGTIWKADPPEKNVCVCACVCSCMVVWSRRRIGRSMSLMYLRIPRENVRKLCIQLPGKIYLERNYQG